MTDDARGQADDIVLPEDAEAQHHADIQISQQATVDMRRALADMKIKHILATKVPGFEHPATIKKEVDKLAQCVVLLAEITSALREDEDAITPLPSGLDLPGISMAVVSDIGDMQG